MLGQNASKYQGSRILTVFSSVVTASTAVRFLIHERHAFVDCKDWLEDIPAWCTCLSLCWDHLFRHICSPFTLANRFHWNGTRIVQLPIGAIDMRESGVERKSRLNFLWWWRRHRRAEKLKTKNDVLISSVSGRDERNAPHYYCITI